MFRFFFKKENRVEELIYSYLENFQLITDNFEKAVLCCIQQPLCQEFNFLKRQTHKYESKADDIIDEINNLMYSKVLIPDSREDIMNLLLALDKIPGHLEVVLSIIKYQNLIIPKDFIPELLELIKFSLDSCETLSKQATKFIKKEKGLRGLMNKIDQYESHCDHIEKNLIQQIFNSKIDPYIKIQLKELILHVGDISDQADRVSKLINILSLKRRV
jgi:predicted phosphate transport protein (TIGR00153 family)